jgi:hypothetical protein
METARSTSIAAAHEGIALACVFPWLLCCYMCVLRVGAYQFLHEDGNVARKLVEEMYTAIVSIIE